MLINVPIASISDMYIREHIITYTDIGSQNPTALKSSDVAVQRVPADPDIYALEVSEYAR